MLGNRIRNLRKSHNYNQTQLAALLNVSQSTVAYYENGQKQPSYDTLSKLADLFDVSIDYLVGRTDILYTKNEGDLLKEEDLTPEKLMDKYNLIIEGKAATKEEVEEIVKYIKALRIIKGES